MSNGCDYARLPLPSPPLVAPTDLLKTLSSASAKRQHTRPKKIPFSNKEPVRIDWFKIYKKDNESLEVRSPLSESETEDVNVRILYDRLEYKHMFNNVKLIDQSLRYTERLIMLLFFSLAVVHVSKRRELSFLRKTLLKLAVTCYSLTE